MKPSHSKDNEHISISPKVFSCLLVIYLSHPPTTITALFFYHYKLVIVMDVMECRVSHAVFSGHLVFLWMGNEISPLLLIIPLC